MVSFDRDADNSYISAASLATEHRNMDLTLKFRTLDMGGLIFYVANADQVCWTGKINLICSIKFWMAV